MRFIVGLLMCVVFAMASEVKPRSIIEASGNVQAISVFGDHIIAGTNAGTIEIYTLSSASLVKKVELPKIKDFMGDSIAPKVFSVDMLEESKALLAVTQASSGARTLQLVEEGKQPRELIGASANLFISKAKFIDKNRILLALMSNELVLFDIAQRKIIYQTQVNPSHFSDFALNETKTLVASSCESGEITISDVLTGKMVKILSSGNVDNVYKVDFKKDKIACAGQDRRGIVYNRMSGTYDRFDAHFLIYATALSPMGKIAAFAFNEENDIVLFDLDKKEKLHTLKGQKSTLNTIVFSSEKELVSGSDDKFILIWRLP